MPLLKFLSTTHVSTVLQEKSQNTLHGDPWGSNTCTHEDPVRARREIPKHAAWGSSVRTSGSGVRAWDPACFHAWRSGLCVHAFMGTRCVCTHGDLVRARMGIQHACVGGLVPACAVGTRCVGGSGMCVYAWGSGVRMGIQQAQITSFHLVIGLVAVGGLILPIN
jgi:hypothetical protein